MYHKDKEDTKSKLNHIHIREKSNSKLFLKEGESNLRRDEGINSSILNLISNKPQVIPLAHGNPPRLRNVPPHHALCQRPDPGVLQSRVAHDIGGDGAEVDGVGHAQIVVEEELLHVFLNADADEGVVGVGEEVEE